RNPEALQRIAIADTGKHENLRRLDGAGTQDDFTARAERAQLPSLEKLDANRALSREQDAAHARATLDQKTVPLAEMGMNIGARGAPPLPVLLRDLIDTEALRLGNVEILAVRKLCLTRGLQEELMEGIVGARLGDVQRTIPAMPVAGEILVALGFLEIRKDFVKAPARVAERRPMVVVPSVAAGVDHGVDRR